jgi:hypothetical protein
MHCLFLCYDPNQNYSMNYLIRHALYTYLLDDVINMIVDKYHRVLLDDVHLLAMNKLRGCRYTIKRMICNSDDSTHIKVDSRSTSKHFSAIYHHAKYSYEYLIYTCNICSTSIHIDDKYLLMIFEALDHARCSPLYKVYYCTTHKRCFVPHFKGHMVLFDIYNSSLTNHLV